MKDIEKIKIFATSSIKEAVKAIEAGALRIALVVDINNKLLGTLTDGDIRRGLLRKKTLDDIVEGVYFKNPVTAKKDCSREDLIHLCTSNKIFQVPILDDDQKVIDLFVLDNNLLQKQHDNNVVLMAGGFGSRLMPLTKNTPKPMLHVGGKPVLQTIVEGFVYRGFTNITMCLGYKSNVIQEFFKDGSGFGAKIDYIVEEKRMGTAGALSLLNKHINKPFFVMNGDLLTNVNYEKMLNFHELHNAKATICVGQYDIEVPYGVVNVNDDEILSIEEKPVHSFFVNAGIYLLEPESLDLIPNNKFYDMPSLFQEMILKNNKMVSFPLNEYWLDIGRLADYKKANSEYNLVF